MLDNLKTLVNKQNKTLKNGLRIEIAEGVQMNMHHIEEISDFVLGIEKDFDFETLDFHILGSGCEATAYGTKEYVVKRYHNKKSSRISFEMGASLNQYPCVAKTLMHVEGKKSKYVVTERIVGRELYKIMKGLIESSVEQVDYFIDEVHKMMSDGVLVSDLHTGNIMVDANGDLKIVDVGEFSRGERHPSANESQLLSVLEFKDLLKYHEKIKMANSDSSLNMDNLYIAETNKYFPLFHRKMLKIIDDVRINGAKSDELEFVGIGTHSNVYSFEIENNRYVLKVSYKNCNGEERKKRSKDQLEVMKAVSSISWFLDNICVYYDEETDVLYSIQEEIKGANGSKLEDFSKSRLLYDVKLAFKNGVITRDIHYQNVSIDKSGEVLIFDTSYCYTIDFFKQSSRASVYGGIVNDEILLKESGISEWMDEEEIDIYNDMY